METKVSFKDRVINEMREQLKIADNAKEQDIEFVSKLIASEEGFDTQKMLSVAIRRFCTQVVEQAAWADVSIKLDELKEQGFDNPIEELSKRYRDKTA